MILYLFGKYAEGGVRRLREPGNTEQPVPRRVPGRTASWEYRPQSPVETWTDSVRNEGSPEVRWSW